MCFSFVKNALQDMSRAQLYEEWITLSSGYISYSYPVEKIYSLSNQN